MISKKAIVELVSSKKHGAMDFVIRQYWTQIQFENIPVALKIIQDDLKENGLSSTITYSTFLRAYKRVVKGLKNVPDLVARTSVPMEPTKEIKETTFKQKFADLKPIVNKPKQNPEIELH